VHKLAQISALTLLFLWHFREQKERRDGKKERKRARACGSACMWTYRYRVSERHACPEPVNVNYCGIGIPGCCKGMIHSWWKELRECKRDYYVAFRVVYFFCDDRPQLGVTHLRYAFLIGLLSGWRRCDGALNFSRLLTSTYSAHRWIFLE